MRSRKSRNRVRDWKMFSDYCMYNLSGKINDFQSLITSSSLVMYKID